MIIILDDVLNSDECNNLIEIYQKNKQNASIHGDPKIYPIEINNFLTDESYALKISNKIENIAKKYFDLNVIDWCQIVRWPCDSWQNYHIDRASEKTTLTSITYLNENFDGGCTIMHDGTKVKPKTGRTIIFDGNKYIHGVDPILKGERYTLPIWYKIL